MNSLPICLLCLAAFTGSAQNLAVLTHGAANTEQYQSGCPSNWPAEFRDIGVSTNLPAGCAATNGWAVWSTNKFDTTKSELSALKEAFNKIWNARNGPGRTWTRAEFRARVTDDEWGAFKALVRVEQPVALLVWDSWIERTSIEEKHPDTIKLMTALSALGVLTTNRVEEILHGP